MAVLRHAGTCGACGGSVLIQFAVHPRQFEHRWACPKCLTVRTTDQAGFLMGPRYADDTPAPQRSRT
ncbi:MAG TPA: hypothetical protein VFO19_02700 [Vicinamibacterales bacterium]|nr:hypothetical protein [Vicinamibacterales bacterium]